MSKKGYVSLLNLQTFLNNLKNIFAFKTEIDEIKESKADWKQNDPSAIDYIKNRTHYDDKAFEDFSWDGVISGETFVDTKYKYTYVKISDQVLTSADINSATMVVTYNGAEYTPTTSTISQEYTDMYYCNKVFSIDSKYLYMFIITGKAGTYDLCTIPSDGTYIKAYMPNQINWEKIDFIMPGTVVQLDEKFIPDTIARTSDLGVLTNHNHDDLYYTESEVDALILDVNSNIDGLIGTHTHSYNDLTDTPCGEGNPVTIASWDGKTSGKYTGGYDGAVYYKIADYMPLNELLGSTVVLSDGSSYVMTEDNTFVKSDGLIKTRDLIVVSGAYSDNEYYAYFDVGGIYAIEKAAWGVYVAEIEKTTTKQLDEKYIPDTIARIDEVNTMLPSDASDITYNDGTVADALDDLKENGGIEEEFNDWKPNATTYTGNRCYYIKTKKMLTVYFCFYPDANITTGNNYKLCSDVKKTFGVDNFWGGFTTCYNANGAIGSVWFSTSENSIHVGKFAEDTNIGHAIYGQVSCFVENYEH